MPRKLWKHPDPESTKMGQFRRVLGRGLGNPFRSQSSRSARVPTKKRYTFISLGIPVEVYDTTEAGEGAKGSRLPDGMPGELVATAALPNIPMEDLRFVLTMASGVWTHGDIVSINPHTRQLLFHGRSDGVLNPSGIHFYSSEIYQVIESRFSAEVADSLYAGQRRPSDTDERIILFLLMKPGHRFTNELVERATVNGERVELPVKKTVSGAKAKPSGTLSNPAILEYYCQFAKVEELVSRESKL
ncbi:Acetoacetyl-CoA synthetase acetoacetate-CoA ligase AACS [Aspergillus parasiticus SU-1]|uniref:Acetoacetyl-CoA synthetase acetoacetate-CoA ligase AACS n=1 Tax=Aspergillus parasiticus (strain ATCC 56775 / NRRL 5862 / SRRC 143 / SU-1) TaxID=1403190 RepID=A0A0F0I307_ASPPU|nr:Acetoacetyl-CoA synthetase acetoacetate-CoA ligase AACS [Aspergillus parasiticus SU-1]